MTPDLLVIGAGVVGLGAAWTAQRLGMSVAVVDAVGPGAGASGVAAGMLAPLCEAPELPTHLLQTSLESARAWPDLAAAIEADAAQPVDLVRAGTLLVATDRDELTALEQAARMLAATGLRYQPLTVNELRTRAPHLHPRLAGGFSAPDDHHVDPQRVVDALRTALTRAGVPLLFGRAVRHLDLSGPVPVVRADDHTPIASGHRVLVAAGAATAPLVTSLTDLPLYPVKGQVIVLRGEALLPCVVRTSRVYLVPRPGGRLVVGATSEELGFDPDPTAGATLTLLREAWRVLPGTYDLHVDALRVGHRPAVADGTPALGPLSDPRVLLATGHHRHGVLLLPATLERLRDGLTHDRWDPAWRWPRPTA